MSTNNDGGPAFPLQHGMATKGMSLRDWFAGQALAGMLASVGAHEDSGAVWRSNSMAAAWAYDYADAMIAARNKEATK